MPKSYESTGTEAEFLAQYKREQDTYAKPSVTVDSVIFRYHAGQVELLLIKRKNHPFMGKFALSGGFVEEQEDLDDAVRREVKEETNVDLTPEQIEQLITVGTPHRDPRMWIISVSYLCYLGYEEAQTIQAGDDAASIHWVTPQLVDGKLKLFYDGQELSRKDLAFDHWDILTTAMERIKGRLEYYPTILQIMPEEATLSTFRQLFGTFNQDYLAMDSTNFLRRFKHIFEKTGRKVATRTKNASTYRYTIRQK